MTLVSLLKFGLSGACIALAYLGRLNLAKEQARPGAPRKQILRAIYFYWGLCLALAVLLFTAEWLRVRNDEKVTYYQNALDTLRTQLDDKFAYEVQQSPSSTIKDMYNRINKTVEDARAKYRH